MANDVRVLPWWLKPVNRVITPLNRLGLAIGTQHILTTRGRKSGKFHSTPVSLMTVDGTRYAVSGFDADWVKNARANPRAGLQRGRRKERVLLHEVPEHERAAILREFPLQVPHGVQYFTMLHGVTADPDGFAALASKCPVFQIEFPESRD